MIDSHTQSKQARIIYPVDLRSLCLSSPGLSREEGKMECLLSIKGRELIGTPVKSPLAIHERIYCLPLLTILMSKACPTLWHDNSLAISSALFWLIAR